MEGTFKLTGSKLELYPSGVISKIIKIIEVEAETYPKRQDYPNLESSLHLQSGYVYKGKDPNSTNIVYHGDLYYLENDLEVWISEGKIYKKGD